MYLRIEGLPVEFLCKKNLPEEALSFQRPFRETVTLLRRYCPVNVAVIYSATSLSRK